jgi:hypothetical protein
MKASLSVAITALVLVASPVAMSWAQSKCPPEVTSAKAILMARGGDVQASRDQDVQAPRNQGAQAGRNKDVQAPRNQDVQAPRSNPMPALRNQDQQEPRSRDSAVLRASDSSKAETLVKEAEAACKVGDTARASEKALAALEIMKR